VKIGDNVIIYSNVSIRENCVIGNNVIIQNGAVIGSDGFGFAPNQSAYDKIPQVGNVVIEDDVEIGANTCIDRATLGSTIIRKGAKLDNLLQIAHNVEIGSNTVIAAQTGVSGSTKIGSHCMIGGQVGFVGHITIGNGVMIGAQAGIAGNLKDGSIVTGTPSREIAKQRKIDACLGRLPDLIYKVKDIEKAVKTLEDKDLN
jgi:UDP-3-O-[3-hydroxymyristoyl] glucosamine N-acyltransferase